MSKMPDEIKRGLECCGQYMDGAPGDICDVCPYQYSCSELYEDNLAYIRQLEADNAQQARCIENMTDKLNAAHDEVAMLQSQVLEWISVEERLPEKGERVLVTNGPKGGFVCESYLNVNGKWMRAGCELVFMTPYYWMPMPEPPKEE